MRFIVPLKTNVFSGNGTSPSVNRVYKLKKGADVIAGTSPNFLMSYSRPIITINDGEHKNQTTLSLISHENVAIPHAQKENNPEYTHQPE